MSTISVILPVYNSKDFLCECIDSIISQTFTKWELIIVDDGSSDGSSDICDKYADGNSKIRVIHKTNGGLSSARNCGLDTAKGEYIYFIDSDDVLHREALSHLYDIATKYGSDITSAHYDYREICRFKPIENANIEIHDGIALIDKVLYQKKNFDNCAWNKLYKTSLFDDLRFYDCWFEDLDIFYKLYEKANIIALSDKVTYFYRKHPASFINRWSDGRADILDVCDRLYEYMAAKHPDMLSAARHRKFSAAFNTFIALNHSHVDNRPLAERCWSDIKKLRIEIISNPKSRLKNKAGAILSFLGQKLISCLSRY